MAQLDRPTTPLAKATPSLQSGGMTLALYIHWPFCVAKCPYCDFNSHVRDSVDVAAWQAAMLADMAYEHGQCSNGPLTSIFFGGGTPSLMPPDLVAALLQRSEALWGFAPDIEITLEANPSSVESARFADLASAGVNRLSLGVQSFDDAALRYLGRAHDATEARAAIDIAQRHFARVSFDLIYALPDQSAAAWAAELDHALAFGTDHLSLYELTIEEGTRFASDVRRGLWTPMEDDGAAVLFDLTQDRMTAAGMPAYEISNHARTGSESRHNMTYWRYQPYVGIGAGAHGRRANMATERHKKPENYLSAVVRNGHGAKAETLLSATEQGAEALLMGLRLAEGLGVAELSARLGLTPDAIVDWDGVAKMEAQGMLTRDADRITTTRAGRLLLNAVLAAIAA